MTAEQGDETCVARGGSKGHAAAEDLELCGHINVLQHVAWVKWADLKALRARVMPNAIADALPSPSGII